MAMIGGQICLRGARKLVLRSAQRLLRSNFVFNIRAEAIPLRDFAVSIAHRLSAAGHPAIDTVRAAQVVSDGEALAGDEATVEGAAKLRDCC
jgi:hypothetical protein